MTMKLENPCFVERNTFPEFTLNIQGIKESEDKIETITKY